MHEQTAGREHANDLTKTIIRSGNVVERPKIDDDIEAVIFEGHLAKVGTDEFGRDTCPLGVALRLSDQLLVVVQSHEQRRCTEAAQCGQRDPPATADLSTRTPDGRLSVRTMAGTSRPS